MSTRQQPEPSPVTHPGKPIERLAQALQDCFDAAVEEGRQNVKKEVDALREHMDARLDRQDARLNTRLDRQDESIRMVWRQVKGNGALPVDEEPAP